MKKVIQNIFMIFGILSFLSIIIFGISLYVPSDYEIEFYLNDDVLIDGDVYFENNYLGYANDGVIYVDERILYPGFLTFVGVDSNGKEFSLDFEVTRSNYDYSYYLSFVMYDDDIILSQSKIENINELILENEIYYFINRKREENLIGKVKRSEILNGIAKEYSARIMETDLFAHTPEEGYDLSQRFKDKKIFYSSASEVLSSGYFYYDSNFSLDVVDGWVSSPGHRSTVLDADKPILWENVGVGVSCKENIEGIICYSVAVFASFELNVFGELEDDYYVPYELYPEGYGFDFLVNVNIDLKSDESIELILVESSDDFDNLINRNKYNKIFRESSTKNFNQNFNLSVGNTLILHAIRRDANYNLSVKYN